MVKILTNLFNKRKREIERLNDIIVKLQGEIRQCDAVFYVTNARKLELERNLKAADEKIIGLQNELNYIKMQVNNTKNEVNSRYY
jgi:hypothetical protein